MKLTYNRTKGETCPQNEFIIKAEDIYGKTYDYSLSVYINSSTKIKVICPKHGPFWVTPNNHLRGKQCKYCSWDRLRKERQLSLSDVLNRFKNIHGEKYDYTKVIYKNCDEKVEIICKKHGSFFLTPYRHFQLKHGCYKCDWHDYKCGKIVNHSQRNLIQGYNEWKEEILKKDNYKCILSGEDKDLQVHHLYSWDTYPNLRFDINNGVTLSKTIHNLFHKKYGRGNNTEEQFIKFKKNYVSINRRKKKKHKQ